MPPRYVMTIGLEVHIQLLTAAKLFAADANRFGAEANAHISAITLAYPGTLPKPNRRAVELATRLALALGSDVTRHNVFARKNYFYPDLPKGYQLSQDKGPIGVGGTVALRRKDAQTGQTVTETIRIHHLHLEEDAGKSVHDADDTSTGLDYNRAGTPLVELVTEPCITSAEQAGAFLTEVRRLIRFLGIGDGNMEEGSLRCDVNLSIRPESQEELGTRVEIKNLNSIRNVQRAIEAEYQRQLRIVGEGGTLVQETRQFDPVREVTLGMRTKETLNDYRYFPDPDLAPVVITDEWLAHISAEMPPLPDVVFAEFTTTYNLPDADAQLLTESRPLAEFFRRVADTTDQPKAVANWLNGPIRARQTERDVQEGHFPLTAQQLADLVNVVADGTVSQTAASQIFAQLCDDPQARPADVAQRLGLVQNRNTDALQTLVDDVLAAWPDKVSQYRAGKKGLLGLFVGEAMKRSNGAADPKLLNQLFVKALS